MSYFSTNLSKVVTWAMIPYKDGTTYRGINKSQRNEANRTEKIWGNEMLGTTNNNQWTTKLGEYLVKDILELSGRKPKRPKKISGYNPDWETDNFIWEVKTRNWTTTGTAGEKVFGVPYKYSDVPKLYGKPLRIVCVGYQEWEFTYGNTRVFGDEISESKKNMLQFWESMDIKFIKFSDLITPEILSVLYH